MTCKLTKQWKLLRQIQLFDRLSKFLDTEEYNFFAILFPSAKRSKGLSFNFSTFLFPIIFSSFPQLLFDKGHEIRFLPKLLHTIYLYPHTHCSRWLKHVAKIEKKSFSPYLKFFIFIVNRNSLVNYVDIHTHSYMYILPKKSIRPHIWDRDIWCTDNNKEVYVIPDEELNKERSTSKGEQIF